MKSLDSWVIGDGAIRSVHCWREGDVRFVTLSAAWDGPIVAAWIQLERTWALGKQSNGKKVKSIAEELLARQKAVEGSGNAAWDDDFAALYPNVHELLIRKLKDDKKVIEPGSVILFARSGAWHAIMSHKGLDLKWFGEGATVKGALEALEAAVGRETASEGPDTAAVTRRLAQAPLDTGGATN